jgi:diguanylate cyclase (GGDEF)-like protein
MIKRLLAPAFASSSVRAISRAFSRLGTVSLACSIACVLAAHTLAEDKPAAEEYPKNINFRNIMQNQDIALGEVEAITEDHEGFMWLGGRNALLRYDGYEFLNILVADKPSDLTRTTPVTQVLELVEDRHKNLWAATRAGLYRYDRNLQLLVPVQNETGKLLFREAIYALEESHDGELLIGAGSGLHIFNPLTLKVQQLDPLGIPNNVINELLVDRQGNLWLGLNSGMLRIDRASNTSTHFVPDPANSQSMAANGVVTMAEDLEGNIWAGTNAGVYRLNPVTGAVTHYQHNAEDPFSLANNIVRQVFVDNRGWVWCGSDGGGISLYDQTNDRFLRFSRREERPGYLSSDSIRRIYEDSIGDIWIGTYPSGVNVFDRSTDAIAVLRRDIDPTQGLLDNNVEAIEIDKDGNLWIGAGGITRYNPQDQTFTHYTKTSGPDSRVDSTSILNGLIDSDGEIRFGTWAHSIQIYNKEKDRFETVETDSTLVARGEKTSDKLNDQMVWSITEDSQRNLWIGTHYNGLTKFDKKTGLYTFYPPNPADPTSISTSVTWISFEDSHGRFWVGTANGLNLMDREQGTFKRYMPDLNNPRALANSSILTIWEDEKNRLWFGTDAGLHLYDPDTDDFTIYNLKDGFIDQGIRVIVEDNEGNLWLGTNNGIVMFNPDTKQVRNYTRYNGELIGGVATGAGVVLHSGEIAFGTRTGLYIFNANKLSINQKIPSVVLTDFKIFTQSVPVGGPDQILTKAINQTEEVILDYTKSMISFHFAALNFRDADKNLYAYRLEGFDDQWREVGNQRTALYTNLPAGKYQFRVKASNNDGVWNEEGHSIRLVILPPPWKTWWAYTLYAAAAFGLLLSFVRNQHQKLTAARSVSRELEQKVAERTAELQNKNIELQRAYAQLEAISLSDPLTGLNNRRYLQKLIPMDIAKVQREYEDPELNPPQRRISHDINFFILDVDFFKSVNDQYGHTAGDQLLIQLSALLTKICRESDCVVRWGGEEFLTVSRFADRHDAPQMAERIRQSIESHNFVLPDGSLLKKTCSIGFASFPFSPEHPMALSWEQVIDIADRALYAAKKSGRNLSVGLAATANTNIETLHQRMRQNSKSIIENKELDVISSQSDRLIWD